MLGLERVTSQYESVNTRDALETGPLAARPEATGELGATVYDVVRDLRRDVAEADLPLRLDRVDEVKASRQRLLSQLDEHLLPRLKELSSPAIVVVAGSTGAGKSTLYNSILGEEVSQAGVLRPTTREPVLAYNPADEDVFIKGPAAELSRVVRHVGVPRGTALLDAPDLDSLLTENRHTANALLEAADLWLFVTTAARYGDALPWQTLAQARERGASVAMVLNRVPPATLSMIRADLLIRLREHRMENTPLFVIPDVGPHEGLLKPDRVAPIVRWLSLLAGPDRSRTVIVRTLKGSLAALPDWVERVRDAVEAQVAAARRLHTAARAAEEASVTAARRSIDSGSVASGAVAARWAQLAAERIDRVPVRRGQARGSSRRGRARERALTPLRDDVTAAARRALVSAGESADAVLRVGLAGQGLPGAADVLPDRSAAAEQRDNAAGRSSAAWVRGAVEYVRQLRDPVGLGAVKALGPVGLAAILLAGAAGQDEAVALTKSILPAEADQVLAALRSDLADRAAEMASREAAPVLEALGVPALGEDAETGLRLRLAELRRLT